MQRTEMYRSESRHHMLAPRLGGFTLSERAAGPHYKAGGGLEAGLGILEKRKMSCFCWGSIAGGHE